MHHICLLCATGSGWDCMSRVTIKGNSYEGIPYVYIRSGTATPQHRDYHRLRSPTSCSQAEKQTRQVDRTAGHCSHTICACTPCGRCWSGPQIVSRGPGQQQHNLLQHLGLSSGGWPASGLTGGHYSQGSNVSMTNNISETYLKYPPP